jgi:hypothetical protein
MASGRFTMNATAVAAAAPLKAPLKDSHSNTATSRPPDRVLLQNPVGEAVSQIGAVMGRER